MVTDALNFVIPNKLFGKSKFPCWFSGTLKHYINKKNHYFRRFKKTNSDKHYLYFAHFCKLVKVTIKTDRRRWLKSVDDSLKTHPQHFCKYVSNFKRKDNSFIQLKIDDQFVTDPKHTADEFATNFESIFNASCVSVNPSGTFTSDFLPTAPISAAEISKAMKRLRPSKCVGLDGIPSSVMKGCSEIFTALLTYVFNLSLTSVTFPSLWKQTAVVPVFKKGNSIIVSNYRPVYILNNFSKIF
jgi:hypothetical protein